MQRDNLIDILKKKEMRSSLQSLHVFAALVPL